MDIKRSLVLLFSSYGCFLFGQEKTIDTVYIFDNQMNKVKLFHKVNTLNPEDLEKNSTNLSDALRFQTSIYIKENGRGAVSSPSFRGTSAGHTAFVWNGININSNFLGQGDVNNIPLFGYDELEIKAGGGSVQYGSSAIGGSIHLNNNLDFNRGFKASLYSEISSFDTYNNFAKASFSNEKFSFKVSGNYFISQNDYEVPEFKTGNEGYINRNGRYYNTSMNVGISYKIAPQQTISWQNQVFDGSQHYPIFAENGNKTKYNAQTLRSLISWDINKNKFANSLKAAYTEDNFQYFGDILKPKESGAEGKNYIFKNDFNYFITPKINFNVIGEFQVNKGKGYQSGIGDISRNMGSAAGLIKYFVTENLRFEAGVKKDFVEDISSPVLYSFSGKWHPLKWYNAGVNVSKNFKIPSFNDLYWEKGGNPDLIPETSINVDMDHEFSFGDFKITLSPYYMDVKNYINWLPTSSGYWAAFNTFKVEIYGLESQILFNKTFGKHGIKLNAGYTYSKSTNKETGNQMVYVPIHKAYGNIDYQYSFMKVYVQGLFNGLTYTTTDEKRVDAIDPYFVMNTGVSATLLKKYTLGFKVNNITNTVYQTVSYYPMPKRNYSIFATLNF
ncbi:MULTISPECIES: TonB-dependent receptor domain-containing protein [Chryseobacterium]|uniref:Iron complex outermembrane receptor protein n=1 Tax=Chryseobacterium geocarposphaerae TaxID=1416776 RepID=A0ABU1LII0_9FLAO|nr:MULTISPECIES: TonB-dependent receptor [Chryseobacterium]MDR6406529.1 iron complex outermembrane receptor protein [Chryseobacterium geocarposphaerae]MDR6699972.1 iron complex outermembrane receptor protein [Chryseobacterium ginsenosidimutans]